ncbi:MAG: dihydrofolate reductase [Nanoarchaeota archaeon]
MVMDLRIIAAISQNGVLGWGNDIPWQKLRKRGNDWDRFANEDFRRFKDLTRGHDVFMGRKTWDSLPRKPLPDRTNYVVSRGMGAPESENVKFFRSIDDMVDYCQTSGGVGYNMGGGQLYSAFINNPLVSTLEITRILQEFEGDTFFPEIDEEIWELNKAWEVKYSDNLSAVYETWVRK